MAHCFNVAQYACALGRADDTNTALLIRDLSLPSQTANLNSRADQQPGCVEEAPLVQRKGALAKQLVALLEQVLVQLPAPTWGQPVFLLLPPGMDSGEDLVSLRRGLQQLAPGLLDDPECRVFAYGACSSLLALRAIENLWKKDQLCKPWMIALDSPLFRSGDLAQGVVGHESVACLSEGAIAVQWEADISGLRCHVNETELQPSGSAEHHALGSVLKHLSRALEAPIDTIYLPDNGNLSMSESWLHSCHQLHPWVTAQTQYEFLAYHTGEIGSSGGLYRLLHLYLAHQSQTRIGATLQCEQGEAGYRSAAVFYWQPAAKLE